MNLSNSQRQLGYTEVLFNSKTQRLVAPLAGDNYTDLTLEVNEDGGIDISQFTTADINLDNPTTFAIPDTSGLSTQKDLNEWIVNALDTVYATEAWVSEQGFLTEVPDSPEVNLDGYATEQWVNEQGFLTEAPEVNLDGYATEQWVNEQGFLTEVPDSPGVNLDGYATEQWVNEQGFLTEVPDSYTKDESDTRYYTKEESDDRFVNVNIQDLLYLDEEPEDDDDDDDDYFALKRSIRNNLARVRS